MKQYIEKDALVAEIDKRIKERNKVFNSNEHSSLSYAVAYNEDCFLKEMINTLEVKEVDLEEELESFAYTLPHSAIGDGEHLGKFDDPKVKEARKHGWSHLWRYNYVKEIAKHFFEAGLNASNPLTWEDMMLIHKCIKDAMNYHLYAFQSADGQQKVYEEVLKRFKTQKGEEV